MRQNVFETFIFLLNLDETNQLHKKVLLMNREGQAHISDRQTQKT